MPSRTSSVSNLKKRSLSSNAVQGITSATSATSLARRSNSNQRLGEKRPIESISKYGSSDINTIGTTGAL